MRRKLFLLTLAAAATFAAAVHYAGCASVWPMSIFYLKRDPAEIATGAKAPPFSLPDANGRTVALEDLLARGSAVLVFYRGHW